MTDEGLTLPGSFAQGDPVLRPPSAADIDRITEICQDPEIQRCSRLPVPYHRDDAASFVALARLARLGAAARRTAVM